MTEKYNGWTNYATWRVNLEMFDGYQVSLPVSPVELADNLREFAEDVISSGCTENSVAQQYALAFLNDVNWMEIANSVIEYSSED